MPRDITSNPANLAYDIKRSVPHDELTVIGNVLILKYGNEIMTCECTPGEDVRVSVKEIGGAHGWIETLANETDTIARMWSSV